MQLNIPSQVTQPENVNHHHHFVAPFPRRPPLPPSCRNSVHIKGEPGTAEFKKDVEKVRSTIRAGGGVRGRLVLFPHQFLHAQVLEPGALTQLLIGQKLFQ